MLPVCTRGASAGTSGENVATSSVRNWHCGAPADMPWLIYQRQVHRQQARTGAVRHDRQGDPRLRDGRGQLGAPPPPLALPGLLPSRAVGVKLVAGVYPTAVCPVCLSLCHQTEGQKSHIRLLRSPWRLRAPHVVCVFRRPTSPEGVVTLRALLGDAKSSLGDAESSLGDAKSSLGDAKSSLGDAK